MKPSAPFITFMGVVIEEPFMKKNLKTCKKVKKKKKLLKK
jgi:hypothetical protein